jgi:hypothetical protein
MEEILPKMISWLHFSSNFFETGSLEKLKHIFNQLASFFTFKESWAKGLGNPLF